MNLSLFLLFLAGSNIIAVQIHKASSNSDKTDTTVASNADTSTASVEPNDTNTRTPKDKPKRLVTTVNEDENVANTLSKKTAEGSVKSVNNENKSENAAANNEDTQGTSQVQDGLDPNRSIAADGDSVAQSIGAVVTEVSSSSSRKWRHATADCLACVRTRPPSSHELREAFFAGKIPAPTSFTTFDS